jgi:hypothetical protein
MPACILLLVLEVLILSLRIRGGNEVREGLQGVVAVAAAEGVDWWTLIIALNTLLGSAHPFWLSTWQDKLRRWRHALAA